MSHKFAIDKEPLVFKMQDSCFHAILHDFDSSTKQLLKAVHEWEAHEAINFPKKNKQHYRIHWWSHRVLKHEGIQTIQQIQNGQSALIR